MKMKQTVKRMVLTGAAVTVMISLASPAVMAQPVVRDHRDGSGGEAAPIVRDHRDDSTSTVKEEEPQQVVCIKAPCPGSSDSSAEEEEPYKDPGIRQCDITPVECEDTEEPKEEEPYKDPGIRQCDITPVQCEGTDEPGDSGGVVRDHRDGDGSKDDEEAASAPGGVKVGENNPSASAPKEEEAVSGAAPADEAGQQEANGETIIGGCAYDDYDYAEEIDACLPKVPFFEVVFGDAPWPDSVGGYVGLLGQLAGDAGTGAGFIVDQGLGYLGDAMVEFGQDGGPIGWAIQGTGYTLGFLGEAGGVVVSGVGQGVDAVVEGVGEAVDAIGDAAGDAWDEVTSWF